MHAIYTEQVRKVLLIFFYKTDLEKKIQKQKNIMQNFGRLCIGLLIFFVLTEYVILSRNSYRTAHV